MAVLKFDPLGGSWHNGNDLANVEVTKITGVPGATALLYTCFVNIDYDGAGNAYGPRDKETLDSLEDAGYPTWWYGLLALHPDAHIADMNDKNAKSFVIGTKGQLATTYFGVELDKRYPDKSGRCPVKKTDGPYPGYFIGATPHYHGTFKDMYKQSSYTDASNVAFGALSGNLNTMGKVNLNDCGVGFRHNRPKQSTFYFADKGATSGTKAEALAECSYKVFLDLGGEPKQPKKTPDNGFLVSFLVFPGSSSGSDPNAVELGVRTRLESMSKTDNAEELALLMSFAWTVGNGKSGLQQLYNYRKKSDEQKRLESKPASYVNVVRGLRAKGYDLPPPVTHSPGPLPIPT